MRTLSIITFLIFLTNSIFSQTTPPNKLCYDYDKAGNRTAQNPAWINLNAPPEYLPDCTPNNPDDHSPISKIYIVKIYLFAEEYPRLTGLVGRFVPILSSEDAGILRGSHSPIDIDINSPLINSSNYTDIYYAELVPTVRNAPKDSGINVNVSIVPNPNIGKFHISQQGFDKETAMVFLYDQKGSLVFQRNYDNGDVNIGELASGTYILILKDKLYQKSVRFIKNE